MIDTADLNSRRVDTDYEISHERFDWSVLRSCPRASMNITRVHCDERSRRSSRWSLPANEWTLGMIIVMNDPNDLSDDHYHPMNDRSVFISKIVGTIVPKWLYQLIGSFLVVVPPHFGIFYGGHYGQKQEGRMCVLRPSSPAGVCFHEPREVLHNDDKVPEGQQSLP